jgi:hypothetical protein
VTIDLDALALGDYHDPVETTTDDGVQAWYAGSTERCAVDERDPRSVSLLRIDDGRLMRKKKELDTRPFQEITISFAEDDGHEHVSDELDKHQVADKVVMVTLDGAATPLSSRDVRSEAMERGAAVCRVRDQRGGPDHELGEGPTGDLQSVDRLIDDLLAEADLGAVARRVEQRVRSQETAVSTLDDEIEALVETAQQEALADADASEPPADEPGTDGADTDGLDASDGGAADAGAAETPDDKASSATGPSLFD